ncbi:NADH-quinone oxidoreductase subunit L [Peribacillus butanolivorans]|uniref:NADH-quinone oxidoreductase subunit L n=1 Tax=Peribacillus butanolivorans TaxID=421767 RepID=A0ABM6XK54_9BACI|nr:NADH-quinone oxidoreductase subunit L [Peribacillus butanolivorans]AXN38825.1 NADH-quinone oxidoreductase subunit L [Peribacillus butanolivorans]
MMENAWLIPIFPLVTFLVLLLSGRRWREQEAYIGILLTLASFILSLLVLIERFKEPTYKVTIDWLSIGGTQLTAGFEINQLNALMLVIVSLVSLLVQIYSKGYMYGEERFSIFYAYLGFFTFAMLGLVMAPNLLQLYFFWELVGVGSFLLIGFYFYKQEAKKAAKKAFIMTRIGDVGLLIGVILLFWETGSFEYGEIFQAVQAGEISVGRLTLIAVLIFIGAVGKSGQFPLHTWLPDAMEGPTPVSALIHAATMVAAGVYLVATMFPLFLASVTAMHVVAVTGGFTAIFAASIALVQKDVKRVLAYSTISQLGFMMLALGTAGYVAGVFHLMTHAFFKALLFLAAGSVIHAIHTQNIEKMGGLWKRLNWTGPLFLIGTLAISGFPLLSGFFSKDEILMSAWEHGDYLLFTLAVITSFLTAFYMFRLFFMIFAGESRSSVNQVKESPSIMLLPMSVLALLAVISGYIQTPWFGTFLGDWLVEGNETLLGASHNEGPVWIMFMAVFVSLAGILLAYMMYAKKKIPRDWLFKENSKLYKVIDNKYFIDEIYFFTVGYAIKGFSLFLSYIEKFIVGGLISTVTSSIEGLGKIGSKLQTGQVQQYGIIAFLGLAVLLVIFALTGGYLR